MRRLTMVLAIVLFVAACGDDDAATTTAATTAAPTTAAPTTAATTTTAPVTTTAAATTAPTTTTMATTTTEPAPEHPHPIWGVGWDDWLPADGATALYLAVAFDGSSIEVPARYERGIEWRGGTWDRVVFGTLERGQEGGAAYVDTSVPWVVTVVGFASTSSTIPDDVQEEELAEAITIDLIELLDGPIALETMVEFALGDLVMNMGITFEMTLTDGVVEVPAGTFDVSTISVVVGGEFAGGSDPSATFEAVVHLHPEEMLVGATELPGFREVSLVEGWG